MNLKLPRSYKPKLPPREVILLDCLCRLDLEGSGIVDATPSTISTVLQVSVSEVEADLASLNGRKVLLMGSKQFAILSRISRNLKQERDRNRIRKKRGGSEDWTFHRRVARAFPSLREGYRPASYNRPAVFESLLREHPHYHRRQCPADVEILTEACYPGELCTVLTFIAEQQSANRTPVLLYTRKAIYVGVRRSPKR
ncbi:hypothetical protein OJ996_25910 [Luteolibacter sp. GHJ8]|uniref:Uncharacterized protein n=1 Tax=Luteolibacter rhizosphaerae TaxID=2989719 RepID=A0ABT3GB31_9BACT|nr:hypothetical protein [Luteolibacter rhizosphaerae]MCW1917052.1 hypothetical protein [Luteolibacter rhizosphaerae]